MLPYPPSVCEPAPNLLALVLSTGLVFGLVLSYLPQHLRLVQTRSSEGLSPWYLLLGSTSSASALLNMVVLQWPLVRCCEVLSAGSCLVALLGLVQVVLQWALFTLIFPLFLVYFPAHLKYADVPAGGSDGDVDGAAQAKPLGRRKTALWTTSVWLAGLTAVHFIGCLTAVLVLLTRYPLPEPLPTSPPAPTLNRVADLMGLAATVLAVLQYGPQIALTHAEGFVGALSIPTMAIQVPGSVAFVVSIAIREGTTWSSWFPYAVTGLLQTGLLSMCLAWKRRQARLGIDDFGRPLAEGAVPGVSADERTALLGSDGGAPAG